MTETKPAKHNLFSFLSRRAHGPIDVNALVWAICDPVLKGEVMATTSGVDYKSLIAMECPGQWYTNERDWGLNSRGVMVWISDGTTDRTKLILIIRFSSNSRFWLYFDRQYLVLV